MGVFDEDAVPFTLFGTIADIESDESQAGVEAADSPDDFDDDELEDASDEDIDFVIELHREDGQPAGSVLDGELANDFDELINQLQRIPGDGGAAGFVSIAGEFFVVCRVRGRMVQVLLSDAGAANYWPLARDIVDYLGEEVPDEDEEAGPIGDMNLFEDSGLLGFELEQLASNYEDDSDEVVAQIVNRLKLTSQFETLIEDLGEG